jgi:hypothetical protein
LNRNFFLNFEVEKKKFQRWLNNFKKRYGIHFSPSSSPFPQQQQQQDEEEEAHFLGEESVSVDGNGTTTTTTFETLFSYAQRQQLAREICAVGDLGDRLPIEEFYRRVPMAHLKQHQ